MKCILVFSDDIDFSKDFWPVTDDEGLYYNDMHHDQNNSPSLEDILMHSGGSGISHQRANLSLTMTLFYSAVSWWLSHHPLKSTGAIVQVALLHWLVATQL